MSVPRHGLAPELLDAAFPFHVMIDSAGVIGQVGSVLHRVCPSVAPGVPVADVLAVATPAGTALTADAVAELDRVPVLLTVAGGPLRLRGQIAADDAGRVTFLGSPWTRDLDALVELGISPGDLAPHDPTPELLALVATERRAAADARGVQGRTDRDDGFAHQAFHDPLTGLANRALFHDRLDHALAARPDGRRKTAVLLIDLDDFKLVNDTLGHAGGDALLCEVADRLRTLTRPSDTVARLGGDEFAILLTAPAHTADQLAGRVLEALKAPVTVEKTSLTVHASVGTAVATAGIDTELLLRRADTAMYVAKRGGKCNSALYRPEMDRELRQRLLLESDLRFAIQDEQFVIAYQPIVELDSGREVGREALLRWRHPLLGLLSPMDFIPIAEETRLIVPIGRWTLQRACTDAASWVQEPPLELSVNVSARQLADKAFVNDVRAALAGSGLDPARLCLEITETAIIDDFAWAACQLQRLRDVGVRIALDDFGAGDSTLTRLRALPIDALKIDRSFIASIASSPQDAAVARALVALGIALDLNVIAEGIEEPDQVRRLRGVACRFGQGYLYGRPQLPASVRADAPTIADELAAAGR